jgi:hypothetical protein
MRQRTSGLPPDANCGKSIDERQICFDRDGSNTDNRRAAAAGPLQIGRNSRSFAPNDAFARPFGLALIASNAGSSSRSR